MSGDVFGNAHAARRSTSSSSPRSTTGTCSSIPIPTPAPSFAERRRLFELPRSSWADYDTALDLRRRRRVLACPEGDPDLRRGARPARVDDGVEALDARRADPCDPARAGRPALQRRHRHLRQGARREPRRRRRQGERRGAGRRRASCGAAASARAATSDSPRTAGSSTRSPAGASTPTRSTTAPGVDTSDHEVNIKIVLDGAVRDGELTEADRNALLVSMTDEVAALVLRDNYRQNRALDNGRAAGRGDGRRARPLHARARDRRPSRPGGRTAPRATSS